jgi:GT2 family glycosyltransferase
MVNTARLFPRVAAVGGKAVNPGRPRVIHGGVRNLERFEPTAFRMSNDAPELDFGQYDYVDRVDHVIGCLHIYDRKVLDDAGVFDIRFSPCQLVDIEHHLRLKLAGYEIVYNGLITFEHLRAMGRKAGKERALIGNSLGNIVKLLHLYDAERVQRYLVERDAARRAWLAGC